MLLKEFYQQNSTQLESFYPGIQLKRLEQELIDNGLSQKVFIDKLKQGIPLEYISNTAYFYKSKFFVDSRVLIPRSESEILVEDAIQYINQNNCESVLDLCTGSGCIALSIKNETNVSILGSDICPDALEVAKLNSSRLGLSVDWLEADLCPKGCFDFIVSNPPYIPLSTQAHQQVHEYEPHLALYIDDLSYNVWFEKLFESVTNALSTNGAFFMEGDEQKIAQLKQLALNFFKDVQVKQDYTQRDRFLYCYGSN